MAHVIIRVNHTGAGSTTIDGLDISSAVRAVRVESAVGSLPIVHLEVYAHRLDIDLPADVRLESAEPKPVPGHEVADDTAQTDQFRHYVRQNNAQTIADEIIRQLNRKMAGRR